MNQAWVLVKWQGDPDLLDPLDVRDALDRQLADTVFEVKLWAASQGWHLLEKAVRKE